MIVLTNSSDINAVELSANNIRISNKLEEVVDIVDEDYIIVFEGMEHKDNFIRNLKTISFYSKGEVIYVYKDRIETAMQVKSLVKCVEVNFTEINKDLLDFVIYSDDTSKGNIKEFDDELTLKNLIEVGDVNYILQNLRDIRLLGIKYLQQKQEMQNLVERLEIQNIDMANVKENYEKLNKDYTDVLQGYSLNKENLIKTQNKLKRCVYSEDSFNTHNLNNYDNPPVIIYLKVFSELIHFDSFLRTLQKSINLKLQSSCKVVNLVNSSYKNKIKATSKHWYISNTKFNLKDIQVNDFIVKGGNYDKLLEYLLHNDMNLKYLIIVDNLNLDVDTVVGKYIKFNICRNKNRIESFGLNIDNTIVNNEISDEYMSYNTLDSEVFKNADLGSQFMMLSTQKAILEILKTIKLGVQIINR